LRVATLISIWFKGSERSDPKKKGAQVGDAMTFEEMLVQTHRCFDRYVENLLVRTRDLLESLDATPDEIEHECERQRAQAYQQTLPDMLRQVHAWRLEGFKPHDPAIPRTPTTLQ
jgi:hypothetical protein